MNFLSGLFGAKKNALTIRYSKSGNTWQVCNESRIVYVGTKPSCAEYIRFMSRNLG